MKLAPDYISFEFYPPKTEAGTAQLADTVSELAAINPQFFSVTFGAGGSTREGTLNTVTAIKQDTNVKVAPHLSCIGATKAEMLAILQTYQTIGIDRIVALRGDLPSGTVALGDFNRAYELVAFIRETLGDAIHIEVAAYPECHPQAKSLTQDILNLKQKFAAGATSAITQYFFNVDAYFYYLDNCAKAGIYEPIIPGIMPITNYERLCRFSEMCGAEIPRWLARQLQDLAADSDAVKDFGCEVVTKLCQQLLAGGAPGLHFYTLNQADSVLPIVEGLGIQVNISAEAANDVSFSLEG